MPHQIENINKNIYIKNQLKILYSKLTKTFVKSSVEELNSIFETEERIHKIEAWSIKIM